LTAFEIDSNTKIALPNPVKLLPFLHLFIIVPLRPSELHNFVLSSSFFPPLSICRNNIISPAKEDDLAQPDLFRLFDVHDSDDSVACGHIPLSEQFTDYSEQRYWRMKDVHPELILGSLMVRVASKFANRDPAVAKVRHLASLLGYSRSKFDNKCHVF
jgi:hypothetical protein